MRSFNSCFTDFHIVFCFFIRISMHTVRFRMRFDCIDCAIERYESECNTLEQGHRAKRQSMILLRSAVDLSSHVARAHLLVFYWLDGGHYFGVIVLNRTNHVQIYGDNSRLSWPTGAPRREKIQSIINWFRCSVNKQSHVFDWAFPLCTYRSLRVFIFPSSLMWWG